LNDLGLPLDVVSKLSTWQPQLTLSSLGDRQNKGWVEDTSGIMGIAAAAAMMGI